MASDEELAQLRKDALGATPGSAADRALSQALGSGRETMQFAVTPLYDHRGRRRSKESIATEGHRVGRLIIEKVDPYAFEGHPRRRATLVTIHAAHAKPYFGDLYDPEIISMTATNFVLRGFSMRDIGYGTEVALQAWLCRPWPK